MLRGALLVLALLATAAGLLARLAGHAQGLPVALWGGAVAAAVAFERWRYTRTTRDAGPGWEATEERFVDPETGRSIRVNYNARTGERRYEADA